MNEASAMLYGKQLYLHIVKKVRISLSVYRIVIIWRYIATRRKSENRKCIVATDCKLLCLGNVECMYLKVRCTKCKSEFLVRYIVQNMSMNLPGYIHFQCTSINPPNSKHFQRFPIGLFWNISMQCICRHKELSNNCTSNNKSLDAFIKKKHTCKQNQERSLPGVASLWSAWI